MKVIVDRNENGNRVGEVVYALKTTWGGQKRGHRSPFVTLALILHDEQGGRMRRWSILGSHREPSLCKVVLNDWVFLGIYRGKLLLTT